MITSVEIEGLRGIKEGKLDGLTPLVVLVGPNGSGKSTILDALYIGGSVNTVDATEAISSRRAGVRQGRQWLLWRPGYKKAIVKVAAGNGIICEAEIKERGVTSKPVRAQIELSIGDIKLVDTAAQSLQSLDDPFAESSQIPLHSLYTQMVQQGKRAEANEILRSLIPNIDHLEILTEGNEPILHIVYSDHSVPVALAGDGIQALLRLCLELAVSPGGTVLLEEPEVHQHPAAIRQSARAIQAAVRRGVQVILTTHSLELIDALLAEAETDADIAKMSVYRLRLDNGLLKSSCVGGEDIAFSRVEIGDDLR